MGLEMNANCFRCSRPAFATLKVEATIGATRLKVSGTAEPAAVCAACLLELTEFFRASNSDLPLPPSGI